MIVLLAYKKTLKAAKVYYNKKGGKLRVELTMLHTLKTIF